MKYLPLLWAGLFRKKTRTVLTMLSVVVSFLLLGLLARAVPDAANVLGIAQRMLTWGVWLNLMLGFFNILPIPPLDGSHVLYHLLPNGLKASYRSFQRFGFLPLLVMMLLFPGAIRWLLTPALAGMRLFVRWASPYAAAGNWSIFPT